MVELLIPRSCPGRPFRPNALLNKAVCNVIASLIFARRFEYNDPCLVRLLDQMDDALKEVSGFLPEVSDSGEGFHSQLYGLGLPGGGLEGRAWGEIIPSEATAGGRACSWQTLDTRNGRLG
jgi:hypothetical protein